MTPGSTSTEGIRRELEEVSIPGEGSSEGTQSTTTGALTIITATSMNGLEEVAEEWEEIEFMVDSGAGATVVGPENVKAVEASEPDHSMSYRLAGGSLIHYQGRRVSMLRILTKNGGASTRE